jgi:putative N6-adenine-specific DNA methylase
MLVMARNNLRNAGIPFEVPLKQIEAQEVKPPVEGPGVVLTNPPYGERIGVRGNSQLDSDEMATAFFSAFSRNTETAFCRLDSLFIHGGSWCAETAAFERVP